MRTEAAVQADLDRRAREILVANDRGGYTVPNGRVYPFQWNWDSAFVALGFSSFDEKRAWREIETLFQAQWDDGFVPHIVFWRDDAGYFPGPAVWATGRTPPTSGITQPPVAATVVRELWARASEGSALRPRLQQLFDKLLLWHRWFARVRDPLGKGFVVAVHPWETGRDNSPEWDAPSRTIDVSGVGEYQRRDTTHLDQNMRPTKAEYDRYLALVQFGRATGWDQERIAETNPFRVADVGMTMILLRANRDLLALAQELGRTDAVKELQGYIARTEAGIDYLWDEALQCYCSRDVITGKSSGFVTNGSFLSFYGGVRNEPRERKMLAHLERIADRVKYLVPSLDPEDRGFDSIRYWRGPVWAVMNYMIGTGLADAGHESWAERIRNDSRALIEGAGFYESFCPMIGRGTGGGDFSWTAAMWLHWARHAGTT
jgi:Trehalase